MPWSMAQHQNTCSILNIQNRIVTLVFKTKRVLMKSALITYHAIFDKDRYVLKIYTAYDHMSNTCRDNSDFCAKYCHQTEKSNITLESYGECKLLKALLSTSVSIFPL